MSQASVQVGLVFPTKDIGADPSSLIEFAPEAERAGFDFVVAYDHVVGADADYYQKNGEFTASDTVHEPMVLFGAMAALTKQIKLVTGVLIPPQRSTALIAKQAAEIDIISNGRLVLGAGIGWNEPEFEALGYDFHERAQRLEEQIPLLRRLWTEKSITYQSDRENLDHVDIKPLPIQKPIPIWVGGLATRTVERAAQLGDGYLPLGYINDAMEDRLRNYWKYTQEYNAQNTGVMGRINPFKDGYKQSIGEYKRWLDNGATHIAIGSSHDCFENTEQYFTAMARFKDEL